MTERQAPEQDVPPDQSHDSRVDAGGDRTRVPDTNVALLMLWAFAAVLGVGGGATAIVLSGGEKQSAGLIGTLLSGGWRLIPFVLFVPVAALVAARLGSASWAGWRRASAPFALRVSLYVVLAGIVVTTVLFAPGQLGDDQLIASRFCRWVWTLSGVGVLLVFCSAPGVLGRPTRPLARAIDISLFNATLFLLCAEGLIAIAARVSSSPVFQFDAFAGNRNLERRVREGVQRFRFKPHTQYFDKELNSRGFVDDEPFVADKRDLVVAVLADSFGVGGGVVPFDLNFATVAERRLQRALGQSYDRVAVHNFSVAWIGLPEYFYLMLTEALPTNPSIVAICLFVGNDIEAGFTERAQSAGYALLGNWRAVELPRRLWRLSSERRRGNRAVLGTIDQLPKGLPSYLHDYRLEPATFSEQRFMEIEGERSGVCDALRPDIAERYQGVFSLLQKFKTVLRDRMLVVLIPDEFQVNDDLWAKLVATAANRSALERNLPQRRIAGFCEANSIAVLDLLGPLREAQRVEPAYHLRDTHWNSRGHRVAGEAIADWILRHGRDVAARVGAAPGK